MALESFLDAVDKKRRTETVTIGGISAKLYLPSERGKYPAVLFNQGLVPEAEMGIANFFPRYLTSLGMAVLVPVYEGHKKYSLIVEDIDHVANAFEYLREHDEVIPDKVGMMGLSYGGYLSLMGAAHPSVRDEVSYAISVCGPVSFEDLFRHSFESEWTRELLETTMKEGVRSELDKQITRARAEESDDLPSFYHDYWTFDEMLRVSTPQEFEALFDELSAFSKNMIQDVSPLNHADEIRCKVMLVHGEKDILVPYSQSEDMHSAIQKAGGTSELNIVKGLGHIVYVRDAKEFLGFAIKEGKNLLTRMKDFILD